MRILILLFFFLIQTFCKGQSILPDKAFYKHIQICNFIGLTEEHFIISLYSDCTIKFTVYYTNYNDQYNSVSKHVSSGNYYILNDTLIVKFTSKWAERKNKQEKTTSTISTSDFSPPSRYIILKKGIKPLEDSFPPLAGIKNCDALLLEMEFQNWTMGFNHENSMFGTSRHTFTFE